MKTIIAELFQDARYTFRQLRNNPFFSLTVILTLALSVGATAAMVGVLRATLLNPLGYSQPQQLMTVGDRNLKGFRSSGLLSVPRAGDLATLPSAHAGGAANRLFSQFAFYYFDSSTLTLDSNPALRVSTAAVSGSFFNTLGTPAMLGRTLTPSDDVANGPQYLVLSHHLWTTAFASDRNIVGRSVRLGAEQATIVGVMPPRFDLPTGIELWHPAHLFPSTFNYRGDGVRFVTGVGRLNRSETVASAVTATEQLALRLAVAHPETDAAWAFDVTSLRDRLFGEYRSALLLLTLASALVLLVTTVNIAGLQLSRNLARRQEFAIRSALGVSRSRLVRQLLTESLLLVFAGSIAGVALAAALLRVLATRLPQALLSADTPHVDLSVLFASLAIAITVGLLTALLPVLQSALPRPITVVGSTLQPSQSGRTRLFGRSFTVLQIALSLILLTVSATVLGNLYRLLTRPLGFDADHVATFVLSLPWGTDPLKAKHLFTQAETEFSAIPGVSGAGAISALPLSNFSFRQTYDIVGQPLTPHHDTISAEGRELTSGYLHAMRIPLLAGRALTAHDAEPDAPSSVLVNRTLAQRYFVEHDPVGQRLVGGWQLVVGKVAAKSTSSEIVGIVGDVQGTGGSLEAVPQPEVYAAASHGSPRMQFALRTTLPATALEPSLRRVVSSIDASAWVGKLSTLQTSVDRSLAQPRLNATLLTSFAGLSLLLVVIGVYGLVAFDVAQRTRELGLRIALGSTRKGVLWLLLGEIARVLAFGLTLGILGSLAAGRVFLATLGATQTDTAVVRITPLLFLTAAVLSLAVLLATFLPARRASRLDPMQALKTS